MIVHTDGGSRGNPGPSGIGVTIESYTRQLKIEISEFVGIKTNNEAEYLALISALELVVALKIEDVSVFSDSELVVKQINGEYTCKSEKLFPLYCQAQALIGKIPRFGIIHIPRERNFIADRLANEAMNRGTKAPITV